MQAISDQIKQLADEGDDARRNIMVALQNLAYSFETPHDTIHRYGHMSLQAAVVQVGINLGLFKYLVELGEPVTVDQISQKAGADPQLMIRLLRFLAAIGAVRETDIHQYAANHVTHNLSQRLVEAGVSHYFGTAAPPYHSLPAFLEQTGYKNPVNDTDTAFQMAFNTELNPYGWFAQNQAHLDHFNAYMALRRQPDATWLSVYPVAAEAAGWPAEKPLFVNMGGGVGHQCAQFREKYPELPGRIVLQDLPHSVAKALPTPGVENMAHDIFESQPVAGAKFYHLRAVLHNHPPHKVRKVLENIKAAMEPSSVLLVDEMVFPEKCVSFNTASIDMTMLSAFASMERTEAQWREVFEDVGLELVRSYTYYPLNYESVMDVRLPRAL
ncbi:S-adenosyl-L-methionine-dependent methyltransferase [Annulohypoxylon bovei var. microspora]|nr:S-adenosyl-L-methionine-dependent methyltransferase [Annulohypoxylon bovei var. microspora]